MGTLCVYLFREFAMTFENEPLLGLDAKKAKELFAYLLLNQERPHRRQVLMTFLWEESSEARAQKYLRQTLWQLQSGLDPCFPDPDQRPLQVDVDWVGIDPGAGIWCDAVEFQEAFQQSQGTPGEALGPGQIGVLQEAIRYYQGDLLEGWDLHWCLIEREHLQNLYLMMLEKLMDACEVNNRYEEGILYGMRALKQDYARERTHRRMMRLYSRLGDRNGALRQYEQCVAALRAELDVAPARRTQELCDRIRSDDLGQAMPGHVSKRAAPMSMLTEVHYDLTQLHGKLAEVRDVMRRDIEVVARLLPQGR